MDDEVFQSVFRSSIVDSITVIEWLKVMGIGIRRQGIRIHPHVFGLVNIFLSLA